MTSYFLKCPRRRIHAWNFLGCLFYMYIYALIFVRWAHITTFKAGMTTGFVLGLLYALSWQAFAYTGHFEFSSFIHEILIGP